MAKIEGPTDEAIEKLRGVVDIYKLRGIQWVARKWPKKPTPPYTALQAEAMAVFAIASTCLSRISGSMLEDWRAGAIGKKESWIDTFRGIIMHYWKENRSIPLVALEYMFIEYETEFRIQWEVLQLYIDPDLEEEILELETLLITKEEILKYPEPMYFSLFDSEGTRLVAPYILFEV